MAMGGGRGAYPREAYLSRLEGWRGVPCVHRVGGLVVAAIAGRGADRDVKESYGWARALLDRYSNCRVLPGSSSDVGSRVIASPTCTVVRDVFKPKKIENKLHVDRKGL